MPEVTPKVEYGPAIVWPDSTPEQKKQLTDLVRRLAECNSDFTFGIIEQPEYIAECRCIQKEALELQSDTDCRTAVYVRLAVLIAEVTRKSNIVGVDDA